MMNSDARHECSRSKRFVLRSGPRQPVRPVAAMETRGIGNGMDREVLVWQCAGSLGHVGGTCPAQAIAREGGEVVVIRRDATGFRQRGE